MDLREEFAGDGPAVRVLRLPAHDLWTTGTLVSAEAFRRHDDPDAG